MLFLIAGIEIEPAILRSLDGARAGVAWLVSLAVALAWVGALSLVLGFEAWHAVAIAMTSTALGDPAADPARHRAQGPADRAAGDRERGDRRVRADRRDEPAADHRGERVGRLPLPGRVRRCSPGARLRLVRHAPRAERVVALVRHHAETTSQAPIRLVVLLLAVMLLMSEEFGLDVILGAFIAGVIVRMLLPDDPERFMARLDGIGFGLLVPVFFVTSGMAIDFEAVVEEWQVAAAFFVSILLVRGLPVLVAFRHIGRRDSVQLALFSATGLPIIVAVTTIAVDAGLMHQAGQSVMVAAGDGDRAGASR